MKATLWLYCVCSMSVVCGKLNKVETRQAAQKANQLVGELVAARCPSQLRKVKSFLVSTNVQDNAAFSERAIELGENRALEMCDQLCEGAVDDKGVQVYTQVKFHYQDIGSMIGKLQSAAQVKLAEEQAMIAAEHIFHQSLIQQSDQEQDPTHHKAKEVQEESWMSMFIVAVFVLLIGGGVGMVFALLYLKSNGAHKYKDLSSESIKAKAFDLFRKNEGP